MSLCAISTCANADCRHQLSTICSKQGPTTTGRACRRIRPAAQAAGDLRRKRARKREKNSTPPLCATLVSEPKDGSVTCGTAGTRLEWPGRVCLLFVWVLVRSVTTNSSFGRGIDLTCSSVVLYAVLRTGRLHVTLQELLGIEPNVEEHFLNPF